MDATAPWLLSFVAPADDLTAWAGVPRRSDQNRAGFQRIEDEGRIERAKEFFQQPENQSPTSLILGLHGVMTDKISATINFLDADDDEDSGGSIPCDLVIEYSEPTLQEARDVVREQLRARIAAETTTAETSGGNGQSDNEVNAVDSDSVDETEIDEVATTDADEGSEDEDDYVDEELELGNSAVGQLLIRMDDDDWLGDADNAKAILDLAKPATIIDGQHRLIGADLTERGIPFSVVALADCPWSEQVFQFTVVNYTAKGIPDQFITANAALSLTEAELATLKTRLIQANVKIKEYDLMRVVNFDPRSPFCDLINLSEKANRDRIGYKTMVQVAAQWFDAKHLFFDVLLPNLYPDITGKGQKTKRRERWRESDWGEFFLAFWQEVYNEFRTSPSHESGKTLWDVGHSQLTVAVVLLELQTAFLTFLNSGDDDNLIVPDGNDRLEYLVAYVRKRAQKFVTNFPAKFFAKKWKITSLNTGSGRADLNSCIRQMVDSRGKYQFSTDRLIVGG